MSLTLTQNPAALAPQTPLVDTMGRQVRYLRLSMTDRCDFRCTYCMPERVKFVSRREVLSLEEFARLARAFIARGVRKIRLTGGEPLLRPETLALTRLLRPELETGALDEITLTTNASRLASQAEALFDAGMRRINVSLDSRNADSFREITRGGDLAQVLAGIKSAQNAGLQVKLNMVVLRGLNHEEVPEMIKWAHGEGMDLTLIENMPMSDTGAPRAGQYMPLAVLHKELSERFSFHEEGNKPKNTAGPAHFVRVEETGGRLGFIAPLTGNFCAGCNRVRVSCTGRLYACLGHNDNLDLRAAMREDPSDALLNERLNAALAGKAEGHDFLIAENGQMRGPGRHMSATGG